MIARMIRILALLAVLALPLGMDHAGAAASSGNHPMAGMDHCGEMPAGPADHGGKAASWSCTMACASALPALAETSRPGPLISSHDLVPPAKATALRGRILEIATPPPRNA